MDTSGISSRPRVLIVEDETMLRIVVAECFEQAGFIVIEAGNATEAVDLLLRPNVQIDIVFTDVRMPGEMDGLGLAAWVQQHHPKTAVLITSGELGLGRTHADLFDAEHFFAKPYCLDEVVECVYATLAKKKRAA